MNCNKILNMYAALSKTRSVKFLEFEHNFVCIIFPLRELFSISKKKNIIIAFLHVHFCDTQVALFEFVLVV